MSVKRLTAWALGVLLSGIQSQQVKKTRWHLIPQKPMYSFFAYEPSRQSGVAAIKRAARKRKNQKGKR